MKAIVIFESMYGNTHHIAEAIATGLRGATASFDVSVVPVHSAPVELLAGADLVVVGGPTHVHGMSRATSRQAAVEAANKPGASVHLDPDADRDGIREWFQTLGSRSGRAAAFDTRVDKAAVLTGRASKGIGRELHRHGFELVVPPESFLVTTENELSPDEEARAVAWGRSLAAAAANPVGAVAAGQP